MEWQSTPVERLQEFKPPFCPRRECPDHRRCSPGFRYRPHASYQVRGGRKVQRYRCLTCGKTFSKSAFSVKYWLKRPELLLPVAAGLQGGSAHRQIARTLGCAPSTVTRLAARIGRHCMLLLERALQSIDPPLTEAIARDQALFPVDLLHALCRHSLAAHKRQTIAFGRRLNALMERLFVFLAWRNFIKGRSERKPDPETPAMRLGLAQHPWNWRMLLARRLFPAREGLKDVWRELYRREWTTPLLPTNQRHDLKLAY